MMADIEHKLSIARPVSDVFKAATDYENAEAIQSWQSAVQSLGITEGKPLRTGTMIAMMRKFMGGKTFVNLDVLDYQRNKRFEIQGIHGSFRYRREIEFVPNGRETSISDKINVTTGFLWFWYRPFFMAALKSQTAEEWQKLKKQLEGQS
jgi:hypothetical protein